MVFQEAGEAFFVPAGWWMTYLSISDGCWAAASLRSHYASPSRIEELSSAIPPPIFVKLKNQLWSAGRVDLVHRIDEKMGTPGRRDVIKVLHDAAPLMKEFGLSSRADSVSDADITEAPRHSHLNPVFSFPSHK